MVETPMLSEVIEFIAEQSGMKPDKLTASSRLLQDVGVDGDDAVEFFAEFEKRYVADLAPLYAHWGRHFGPEGFGTPMSFLVMLLLLIVPIVLIPLGVSPMWSGGAELVGILIWFWPLRQWPLKDNTIAITVADLVSAAETRRWPLVYDKGA
jgi:acyl carrier protein